MADTCVYCGAPLDFELPPDHHDGDEYICTACAEVDVQEPDHNDAVLCCPDCERPNQFGEVCSSCERERQMEIECDRTPQWDESACMGSMD